ncbi:MAG: DUF2071 domain-containing protein [Verrucomicrobiota bacterium]
MDQTGYSDGLNPLQSAIKIPVIHGLIRRRLLLNYRIDPDVVGKLLPRPFRPKLHRGYAIAGICLIRLEKIRPKGFPAFVGVSSENSAHRIAVTWTDSDGQERDGVFIPRRDTGAWLNSVTGGRIFPGVHHYSRFEVNDQGAEIDIDVSAKDHRESLLQVSASVTDHLPKDSVFESLRASSDFFESGCVGYSPRLQSEILDGLLLKVTNWEVTPLNIHHLNSAYFDNRAVFRKGAIHFDHALLMRDIDHEWHAEPNMRVE